MNWILLGVGMTCMGFAVGTGRRLYGRWVVRGLWAAAVFLLGVYIWNEWIDAADLPTTFRAVITLGAGALGLCFFGVGFQAGHRGLLTGGRDNDRRT